MNKGEEGRWDQEEGTRRGREVEWKSGSLKKSQHCYSKLPEKEVCTPLEHCRAPKI